MTRTASLQINVNGTDYGVRWKFADEELALAKEVGSEHTIVEARLAKVLADHILRKYKDSIVWENDQISSE